MKVKLNVVTQKSKSLKNFKTKNIKIYRYIGKYLKKFVFFKYIFFFLK